MGVNGDLEDVETGKMIPSNGNDSLMLQSTSPGLHSTMLHPVIHPLFLQDLRETSYFSRTKWIAPTTAKSTSIGWQGHGHTYRDEKDYDSINDTKIKIEPYQNHNDDDNRIRQCNWNYVYSEVVWYLTTDGTCALPLLCCAFFILPLTVLIAMSKFHS